MEVARHLFTSSYYEWSAYTAQQAAEKTVKAQRIMLATAPSDLKSHDMTTLLGTISSPPRSTKRSGWCTMGSARAVARGPGGQQP